MTRIGLGMVLGGLALACAPAIVNRGVSYQISSEVKPVGDVEGHFAGPWTARGLCLTNVASESEEVGIMTVSGTFDAVFASATVKKSCTMTGKTTCVYRDKSSYVEEWVADCVKDDPLEGRGTVVRGTGRFEGATGPTAWKSKSYTPGPEYLSCATVTRWEVAVPRK